MECKRRDLTGRLTKTTVAVTVTQVEKGSQRRNEEARHHARTEDVPRIGIDRGTGRATDRATDHATVHATGIAGDHWTESGRGGENENGNGNGRGWTGTAEVAACDHHLFAELLADAARRVEVPQDTGVDRLVLETDVGEDRWTADGDLRKGGTGVDLRIVVIADDARPTDGTDLSGTIDLARATDRVDGTVPETGGIKIEGLGLEIVDRDLKI